MSTLIAISGSLRSKSFNTMLLHAAIEVTPAGTTVEIASIRDIPLYDGDVEAASGVPAAVEALKDRLAGADGLLVVSPEYNNSMPGVLKNAIDWLTRPPSDIPRVFGELPVGLIGATPGRGGTNLAQASWLPVLRTIGTLPYFGGRLGVGNAGSSFDERGKLTDAKVRSLLEKYLVGFVAFVERHKRAR
jgi:NAD(P)H-dependent FMN reductase